MISEEEKKAIERIKYNDIAKPLACGDLTICNIEDLQTILNLIKKQNKELMLNKLGKIGKQGCLKCKTVENAVNLRRDNIKLKQETELKDKMIDEMAKELANKTNLEYEDICINNEECHGEYCKEHIKEYFRKKVKNDIKKVIRISKKNITFLIL